jgi:Bacterial regulatory protein, Fis family
MFRTESFYEQVKAFECQIIRTALANAEGNQALAARRLGLAPTTLSSQLRRLGIDAKAYKLFTRDQKSFLGPLSQPEEEENKRAHETMDRSQI